MSSEVSRRIIFALQANGFGQVVNLLIQVASIPIFLTFWTTERYGSWLIISAIPAYMSMSDLGFGNAAANTMTLAVVKGDSSRAAIIYKSAWALTTCISTCAFFFVILLAGVGLFKQIVNPAIAPSSEVTIAILILALSICVSLQGGIISAVYRSVGKYPVSTIFSNLIRITEFLAGILALAIHRSFVGLAIAYLIVRVIGVLMMYIHTKFFAPWAKLTLRNIDVCEIKLLAKPAFSFAAIPLAAALNQQGILLAIAHFLGPIPVVAFSAMKTITRLVSQAVNIMNNSVWPELTAAFGRDDVGMARIIHRRTLQVVVLVVVVSVIFLSLFGKVILSVWTNNKVQFELIPFLLMLLVVSINSLWYASSVVAVSINKHGKLAIAMIYSALVSLIVACILSRNLGLSGVVVALVIGEVIMLINVLPSSISLTSDSWKDLLRALISWPDYLFRRGKI